MKDQQIPTQIFVISLPKSLKRRESMEKQFSDAGLTFEYTQTVEIKDLEYLGDEVWSTKLEEKFNKGEYQKGEIACAASHRNVYKKMIEENIEKALICEDDIIIPENFKNILENLSQVKNVDWLQIDYPKSGFGFFVNWLKANHIRIKNNSAYVFIFLLKLLPMLMLCSYEFLLEKIVINFTKNKYKEVKFFRKLFFASCYIVSLDSAKKLLIAQTPLMYTADRLPNTFTSDFIIKGVMPRLVYQDNKQFASDLLITDSQNVNLENIIQHENDYWSNIFKKEISKPFKKFSSCWWEDYYKNIVIYFDSYIIKNNYLSLLEAGSGSGKASILLRSKITKTLLDISTSALDYSRYLAENFKQNNITFAEGDIFNIPRKEKSFDFVWNIGVIEHYEKNQIINIMEEMIRVTSENGTVAIAIPNFYSGPIIKAKILSLSIFKFIPGYRLDSEKFYSEKEILDLFSTALFKSCRDLEFSNSKYFGNPLIMETPSVIMKILGKYIYNLFPKNRFIKFFIFKLK